MGNKWGRVPSDSELTTILAALSKKVYQNEWNVGIATFNVYRDPAISAARRILRVRNLPATAEAWAELVIGLTGKPIRPADDARRQQHAKTMAANRWRNAQAKVVADPTALIDPAPRLGPSQWQLAHNATDGLPVVKRLRPIRQWQPLYTKDDPPQPLIDEHGRQQWGYVIIGEELVYEVR